MTAKGNLTLFVNPGGQPGEYLVELRVGDKTLAQGAATIDRQALLVHEHSFSPRDYGQALFQALVAGALGQEYQRVMGALAGAPCVRIQLVISSYASELHALPWERLFQRIGTRDEALACSAATPFSRFLITGQGDQPPVEGASVRLLVAMANPIGLTPSLPEIDVVAEASAIAELSAGLPGRLAGTLLPGRTELPGDLRQRLGQLGWTLVDGPASWPRIQRHLHGVHVLHILAHGQLTRDGTSRLLLEGEAGDRKGKGGLAPLSDQDMADGLSGIRPLPQLVFLAACESAKRPPDAASPFVGLAPRLVGIGVPAVVAMQDLVPMALAHELTLGFYRRLLEHGHVDLALNQARAALLKRDAFEWAVPVLFLRSADGRLFAPQTGVERQPFEPETVFVPAGGFLLGSAPGPGVPAGETPQDRVDLPAFRIGRFPVTNREYAEYVRQSQAVDAPPKSGWFNRKPPSDRLDHPVAAVSWQDSTAYCAWLRQVTRLPYRLPGEAEWEKAARGGDGRRYPWGDEWDPGLVHFDAQGTTPVADHPGGASPFGCEQMLGNLEEWTRTLWGTDWDRPDFGYPWVGDDGRDLDRTDALPVQGKVVHRGGSYRSPAAELYCARRGCASPESRIPWRGFRVLLELEH